MKRRRALRIVRAIALLGTFATVASSSSSARAQESPPNAPEVAEGQIDLTKDMQSKALVDTPALASEAPPPPPPYKPTIVLDSSLGALVFLGKFGKTSPPAPWMRTQLGYELLKWLMVFAEGELAFSDTSRSQEPPRTRAFPIFALGTGARFTVRFSERVGAFAQGSLGMMKADIRTNALGIIGFEDAETFHLYLGGRVGLEWYQLDRHFALGVTSGIRNASGFKQTTGSDTPLAFDAGASLRYAF